MPDVTSQSHIINKDKPNVPATVNVAIFATYKSGLEAINDVCHYIENNLSDITQLPELFFVDDKSLLNDVHYRQSVEQLSVQFIHQISQVLRPFQFVCTSLILEDTHQAVIISHEGVVERQKQVLPCQRYPWTSLNSELSIKSLTLEQGIINVAMMTADDLHADESYSQVFPGSNSTHLHLLLLPFDIQREQEVQTLKLNAAQHQVCMLAASREKSFNTHQPVSTKQNVFAKNKQKLTKTTGFIANVKQSITVSRDNKDDENHSLQGLQVKDQFGKITKAVIHPLNTVINNPCTEEHHNE